MYCLTCIVSWSLGVQPRALIGLVLSEGCEEALLLSLPQFLGACWQFLVLAGLWMHHPNVYLHLPLVASLCVCPSFSLIVRSPVVLD